VAFNLVSRFPINVKLNLLCLGHEENVGKLDTALIILTLPQDEGKESSPKAPRRIYHFQVELSKAWRLFHVPPGLTL
jgi:hypothetical protein